MPPEGFTACVLTLSFTSAWREARDASIQRWTPLSLPNCASSFTLLIRNFTRSQGGHLTGPKVNFIQHCVLHPEICNRVSTRVKYALFRIHSYPSNSSSCVLVHMQCVTKYNVGSIFYRAVNSIKFTLCIIGSFYAIQLNE